MSLSQLKILMVLCLVFTDHQAKNIIVQALKTLKKYMKYIKNMFKSNITNGLIEGLNNKINSIK